jgi:hypothetical protein
MEGIWSRTFGRVFGPALRTENPSFSLATRTQISNRAIPGTCIFNHFYGVIPGIAQRLAYTV